MCQNNEPEKEENHVQSGEALGGGEVWGGEPSLRSRLEPTQGSRRRSHFPQEIEEMTRMYECLASRHR